MSWCYCSAARSYRWNVEGFFLEEISNFLALLLTVLSRSRAYAHPSIRYTEERNIRKVQS